MGEERKHRAGRRRGGREIEVGEGDLEQGDCAGLLENLRVPAEYRACSSGVLVTAPAATDGQPPSSTSSGSGASATSRL